jgi:Rho GTPase-activating protein RGD1
MSTAPRQYQSPVNISGPPQLSAPAHLAPMSLDQPRDGAPPSANTAAPSSFPADLPPLRPVFGVSLRTLFERDGLAVPMIVYQCIQAVDLYGLEVEGIYRVSGTNSHVQKIRAMFDNGGDSKIVIICSSSGMANK